MWNQLLDNSLPLLEQVVCAENLLTKLAECSFFTLSIKDIKTRKIFLHNRECAEVWGLGETGLNGMTSRDCLEQVPGITNIEGILKSFEQEEIKALDNDATCTNKITILDYEGFVRIRQHFTLPVCGVRSQTVAIGAVCVDLTRNTKLLHLINHYLQYYTKPKAIEKISKYLKLDRYFQFPLTFGELSTLLASLPDPRHKQVAIVLSKFRSSAISPLTISGYVNTMKDKLRTNLDLHMVLASIRGL